MIVASATTLISLALGTPAAFAFARLQIPFKTILLLFILGLTMLPTVSIIIPLFVTGQKLGLLNTRLFLIVCYTTFSLPFTIWIMNGYFRTIPKEMEDAARIDGCSTMGLFMRIALPLAAPGLAATAIFTFLNAWDEFMMALIFTSVFLEDFAHRCLRICRAVQHRLGPRMNAGGWWPLPVGGGLTHAEVPYRRAHSRGSEGIGKNGEQFAQAVVLPAFGWAGIL